MKYLLICQIGNQTNTTLFESSRELTSEETLCRNFHKSICSMLNLPFQGQFTIVPAPIGLRATLVLPASESPTPESKALGSKEAKAEELLKSCAFVFDGELTLRADCYVEEDRELHCHEEDTGETYTISAKEVAQDFDSYAFYKIAEIQK